MPDGATSRRMGGAVTTTSQEGSATMRMGGVETHRSGEPAVELRAASKRYGAVTALDNVDLVVRQGEVVALLGPNGAGKTTAIEVMLGLRQPTSGTARLFGLDPRDLYARSRCGVMLQESGVPGSLTVIELVDLFRSYYPRPLNAAAVIAAAGLQEKARTRAGVLSGGQRQRLYFALAICGDPDLIFLDEPTAALDVEARHDFWTQVRAFVHEGKTVLLTTHYLEEADALADRIIVIDKGRIAADATPAALKARVAGKRVSFDLASPLSEDAFAGLPVQGLTLNALHVTLLSSAPEVVLSTLFDRGAQLVNLEVVGAGLEEAVLTVTHAQEAVR